MQPDLARIILTPVWRRIIQFVAALVLILAALTPLAECCDHWDGKTTVPANDPELRLTVFFAGAGALLVLAQLVRYAPVLATRRQSSWKLAPAKAPLFGDGPRGPVPTAGPPLLPLRI